MDNDAKIALYRIAQEALTNIERHAVASEVIVDLRGHRQGATLVITDNGRGILNDAQSAGGLGLRNMQERMDQLGGSLSLETSSTSGTRVKASVPLTHLLPPEPNPNAPARNS